jgi:hypothetical protein
MRNVNYQNTCVSFPVVGTANIKQKSKIQMEPEPPVQFRNLEWSDLDKRKLLAYNAGIFFVIRFLLYPANFAKTNFQMQRKRTIYKSATQMFLHTLRTGGVRALYAGFPTASLTLIVQQAYLVSYEFLRASDRGWPKYFEEPIRNGISAAASVFLVQLLGNPIDVVSQRQQIARASESLGPAQLPSVRARHKSARDIVVEVYRSKGLRGFFSGIGTSVAQYAPASALWWTMYPLIRDLYYPLLSRPTLPVVPRTPSSESLKGPAAEILAGGTCSFIVAILFAPLDIIRTHAQVESLSGLTVARQLVASEGIRGLWKGAGARTAVLVPQGVMSITVYEQVKRWSVEPLSADAASDS